MRGTSAVRSALSRFLSMAVALVVAATPAAAERPPRSVAAGTAAFSRLLEAATPTPTFARQTGMACNMCHTQFPELTAFGRAFKLDGYTLRQGETVEAKSGDRTLLLIGAIPALSFMVQTSYTVTAASQPDSRNGDVLLPDQLSLFLGGEITPRLGGFAQVTYDGVEGDFGLDNADLRFADQTKAFGQPLHWGLSLNNAPTVQDLWNSTPVWGFPYASSPAAPAPAASPLLAGNLAQEVAGLTVYGLWAQKVYLEAGAYRSAPTGVGRPLPDNASGDISGVAPYWRIALQHNWSRDYAHVGAYGMVADRMAEDPAPAGTTDQVDDIALDASWLHHVGSADALSTHATWIHENVHPGWVLAGGSVNERKLDTFRLDATFFRESWLGLTLAPFRTTGTTAPSVYAAGAVDGSRTGSPDSSGLIGQASFTPWLNTKFTVQYTAYSRFNGASTDYDGQGRNASDNNTFYLVAWILF